MSQVKQIIYDFEAVNLNSIPPPPPIDENTQKNGQEIFIMQKDVLNCKICLQVFTHPIMLPCQHSYCFECVAKSCSKKYADEIDCPECRQPAPFPKGSIIYLPFNRMLGKMLEDNGSSDHVLTKSDLNIILKSVKQRCRPSKLITEDGSMVEDEASDSDLESDSDDDSGTQSNINLHSGSSYSDESDTSESSDSDEESSTEDSETSTESI